MDYLNGLETVFLASSTGLRDVFCIRVHKRHWGKEGKKN